MKNILVIGAGWEQYTLISRIKEEGHFIIATHPQMNNEGFSIADKFFVKDPRDIVGHLNLAKTYEIDAVVTDNCDFSLYTAAIISKKLALNFADIQSAVYSNDKLEQRKKCFSDKIKQPNFLKIKTYEDLDFADDTLNYPLIIKPVDSRGTFGVSVAKDRHSLNEAYFDAISNSNARTLICEEFINGTLVTVDGFCFSNGHKSLAVASREFEEGVKPITKEIIYPAKFGDSINKLILENHNNVVKSLNYNYGHTHGEYIITENQEIYLVECANRGGGVYTSSTIVPNLTGIDLNLILLNQSLGIDNFQIKDKSIRFMRNSTILTFLNFNEGKVIKSINVDELLKLPFVLKFKTTYKVDEMVEPIEHCGNRHSMLVISDDTVEKTLVNLGMFKKKMDIKYY